MFGAAGAESIQVYVETRLKPQLIGEDPLMIGRLLSIHVGGALANGFLVELMDWMPGDLFTGVPRCEDGHLPISDTPGHGLALIPGAETKYRL